MDEKPPSPVDKPPSLPKEEIVEHLDEYKSKESSKVEEVEAENLDVPKVKKRIKKEIIIIPIEPIVPKKAKEEKNYDEKYFKPRRKRMVDYVPEPLP